MESKTRKYRLPRLVIIRSVGLLPMLYKPSELCDELGVADSTLRDWLQAGVPQDRDQTGHLWINGEKFAAWVKDQQQPRSKTRLKEGEGYCMTCRKVAMILNPTTTHVKGKLLHIKGTCPHCGNLINRGGRFDRASELPQN